MIIIFYLFIILEMFINKNKIEVWILFLYSLSTISFVIPILDKIHSSYVVIIPFIILIYIINTKLKKISNIPLYILYVLLVILVITNINSYNKSLKNNAGIYKYIPTNENQQRVIKDVNDYVTNISKDSDVYVLDISAALFNLNINKYNKYFDMFMNGNFGIKGEKEMYDIIDSDNKIFLINDNSTHWQLPTTMTNYIKENYNKCGSIDYLTVYCNRK